MSESIVVPHRVTPPGLPARLVERPRLNEMYSELYARFRHVAVVAPAGAGKTVQAQLFARSAGLPLSWLTLRPADSSPSRLLEAIASAVTPFAPAAEATLRSALRSDLMAEESAAVLAPTIASEPFLLVVDQCESIVDSPEAIRVLSTFADYAPPSMFLMTLSRQESADVVRLGIFEDTIGIITEDELNLTKDEAAELMAAHDGDVARLPDVLEATGGWMAGVLFGSHGRFTRSGAIDLSGYIRSEVLGVLPKDEQQFLLDTTILDVVTPEGAEALIGPEARGIYERIRTRHLPAVTATPDAIVYHSVLRSVLRAELLAQEPTREQALLRRYGEYLMKRRHFEEATEVLLTVDDLDRAAVAAEGAIPALYERSDWSVLHRWLEQLGEERVRCRPLLTAAEIRSLYGLRRFAAATTLIRRLDQLGQLRPATEEDSGLAATMGWALQADPAEARRLLDRYSGDYRASAVRFMLDTDTGVLPAVPPPMSDWGEFERLVSWSLLIQGRLKDVARLVPEPDSAPLTNPNVLLGPLWMGDPACARQLWERVPDEIKDRPHSMFIEGCLLLAEGEVDAARSAVEAAVSESHKTGFPLHHLYEAIIGLALVADRNEDAVEILQSCLANREIAGQLAWVEWIQAFLGAAYLRTGRLPEARSLLQESVRSMERAKRRLVLPFAAYCLSEVETAQGDTSAAAEMASLALHISSLTGGAFWLSLAVALFPEVRDRELQKDPHDGRWRQFDSRSTTRVAPSPSAPSTVSLYLQPFGRHPDLYVNGEPKRLGRLKMLELVAYLCLHPDGVDRTTLQQQLFPESDQRRGGNHFRQIAHKLRTATGVSLDRVGGSRVRWPDHVTVDAADLQFERLLAEASQKGTTDRRTKLAEAIELTGTYLEKSDLSWVSDRRYQLDVLREEALLELSELCVRDGDFEGVRVHCERLLEVDPYNEGCYRLLMQAEGGIGSPTSVLAVYRRAVAALQELGLSPSEETKDLARQSGL